MPLLLDWQFWGVVVGILGVFVTVIIFYLQKNRKRLAYQVLTDTPLLSVGDEIKGRVKITYDNKDIQNVHLVVIKIENVGNVDIAASDFARPMAITFPNSEVLSTEVSETFPKTLNPILNFGRSGVSIEPVLLNKKDFLTIKFVFSHYENKIDVNAHILGVKDIERGFEVTNKAPQRAEIIILLSIACGLSLMVGGAASVMFLIPSLVTIEGFLVLSIGCVLSYLIYAIIYYTFFPQKNMQ